MPVRPAKTQISLGIRPVWSESSLCASWVAKDPGFLHADSEDSGQNGRMPRLIRVFAGRTLTLLVLSCRGSSVVGSHNSGDIPSGYVVRQRMGEACVRPSVRDVHVLSLTTSTCRNHGLCLL